MEGLPWDTYLFMGSQLLKLSVFSLGIVILSLNPYRHVLFKVYWEKNTLSVDVLSIVVIPLGSSGFNNHLR